MPAPSQLATVSAQAFAHSAAQGPHDHSTTPVRVAHCLDTLTIGGTETNALRTIEHLDASRFPALLVYGTGGVLEQRFLAATTAQHRVKLRSLYHPSTVGKIAGLAAFFRRERVQVVHCHDVYSNVFAAAAARVAGVPGIIVSRRWGLTQYGRGLTLLNRHVGYRLGHRVLANSAGVARSVMDDEGVPRRRVLTLPNFVGASLFEPISEDQRLALRHSLGLPPDALVVGVVATVKPVKDPLALVDAVASLAPEWPTLRLVFVGDGESRAAVTTRAETLQIADRVTITGMRQDAARLHAAFDVSALTSLSEGFPNSLVEAMAAARPVVATRVGGVPDAVRDGESGLLVPVRDPGALRAALQRLLEDPALRRRLGEFGREAARRDYHERTVLAQLEAVYAGLAAGRR